MFRFFGTGTCAIKNIRTCSGYGHLISPDGDAEREIEWSFVDDNGEPTHLDRFETYPEDQSPPEYRCTKCGSEFDYWADVLEHVSDIDDDDDGGVGDADSLGWSWGFGRT